MPLLKRAIDVTLGLAVGLPIGFFARGVQAAGDVPPEHAAVISTRVKVYYPIKELVPRFVLRGAERGSQTQKLLPESLWAYLWVEGEVVDVAAILNITTIEERDVGGNVINVYALEFARMDGGSGAIALVVEIDGQKIENFWADADVGYKSFRIHA